MQRRSFLLATGQALAFTMTARKAHSVVWSGQQPGQVSSGALEQRVASVLQAFDAQETTAQEQRSTMHPQSGWLTRYSI